MFVIPDIPPWRALACLVAFRGIYYLFGALCPARMSTPGFSSRFTSACHCVVAVLSASLYLAGVIDEHRWVECSDASLGYLAHDLLAMVMNREIFSIPDICHHVLFGVLILYGTAHFPHMLARGLLAEVSLPFLYIGWAMIKLQMTETHRKTFWGFSVAGMVLFFIFRILNFTHLMHFTWMNTEMYVTAAGAVITTLNYYWFIKLLRKVPNPTADDTARRVSKRHAEAVNAESDPVQDANAASEESDPAQVADTAFVNSVTTDPGKRKKSRRAD